MHKVALPAFHFSVSKHGVPQKPQGLLGMGRWRERGMEVGEEGDYI